MVKRLIEKRKIVSSNDAYMHVQLGINKTPEENL